MKPIIDTDTLKNIIIDVAKKELLPRFANVSQSCKADNSIVTEADICAQKSIASQLHNHWPDIPLLGEEMSTEEQTKILASNKTFWCLDPLDGTSNFAAGIPYFAISLALIHQGEAIIGIVYDPIKNEYFCAIKDKNKQLSATLNNTPLAKLKSAITLSNAIAIVDLKRLSPDSASRIASQPPYASQRNFGASALDWCWLAASRSHVYLHGNQNIWDYAAGELIFRAVGGKSVTLEGDAVFKQQLQKRSVVAAISHDLFYEWKQWLNIK